MAGKKTSPKSSPKSSSRASKPAARKSAVAKVAPKKPAAKKPSVKKAPSSKPVAKKSPAKPVPAKGKAGKGKAGKGKAGKGAPAKPAKAPEIKLSTFQVKQRARLLALKDTLLDSMNGVARDSLRTRADGSEASAFGMHQADAGSDAYDRDFALSLLSQEQDSLYEIDEALKRLEQGAYGVCEISGKPIPHPRLQALPFTRYTVECQAELEKRNRLQRVRQPVGSLFGLNDDDQDDSDDDNNDSKD